MNIAIIGASGSIGSSLTEYLLRRTSHSLTLLSHNAEKIHYRPEDEKRLNQIDGDILIPYDISKALRNADIAIYLVHLMGNRKKANFTDHEKQAAYNFVQAANKHKVKRIIYVGGMGSTGKLTNHLASRQQTGEILKANLPLVIEFNVPMVVGPNAAGFEVIRQLVHHTKVLPIPTWANATTQPICLSDVTKYVAAAIELKINKSISIDIGGPETLSYTDVIKRYVEFKDRSIRFVYVPFVPKRLVSFLFRLYPSSKSLVTVADMIESASYSTSFDQTTAKKYFKAVQTRKIDNDFF